MWYLIIILFSVAILIYVLFMHYHPVIKPKPKYPELLKLEELDFLKNNYYSFEASFSLNCAEPTMLTLFVDTNNYLNFALHCTDSNKYKVGFATNFEVTEFNEDSEIITFDWLYHSFTGESKSTTVQLYRYSGHSTPTFRCLIRELNFKISGYEGIQLS